MANTQSPDTFLASILDNCSEAFLHCSTEGKVVYFNTSYSDYIYKIFHNSIEKGKLIYDLYPNEYRDDLKKLHKKIIAGEKKVIIFPTTLKTGETLFFEISLTPVFVNKNLTGFNEVIREATDRIFNHNRLGVNFIRLQQHICEKKNYFIDKDIVFSRKVCELRQIEDRLKEKEIWLSQIIHSTSIPTFVIDKNHTITHWNKACELLTGIKGSEMIGTNKQWKPFYGYKRPTIADLVLDKAPRSSFQEHYGNRYRKTPLMEEAFEAEGFFDFESGEKWLFFTAAPLKEISGEVIGAIETFQDITDRKNMEKEVQESHRILEQRIEERTEQLKITYDQLLHAEKLSAVGKLAASIAHEFGNPIIGIRNFLKGLLKDSSLSNADSEVIELAILECQRVKELISNLQGFNRPTTGTMELINLHKAINDMLLFCKKDLKEKQVKIVKQYGKNIPPITAVADQIKQVILNCLNNAAESIKDNTGKITIKTELVDEYVLLHISDTGRGIKSSDLDYIFDPFFSTKAAVEGTGLGLSVSYGIIKRHSGDIKVTETNENGTTFTISLPTKHTDHTKEIKADERH